MIVVSMDGKDERYPVYRDDDSITRIYRELERSRLEEASKARAFFEEEKAPEKVVVKEAERPHITAFRMDDDDRLEYLKLKVDEVIGTISERKKFLEKRINELEEAIRKREELHEEIVRDIMEDIREKESLMRKMSRAEDIRDVMLDISALKSQKRKEEVQFWRDITQLKNELAVLKEEYEVTKKISSILEEE